MDYERIPADPIYVQALGRAFYNFVYLEQIVFHMIGRLHRKGYDAVGDKHTAGIIADTLKNSIKHAELPVELRDRLFEFQEQFSLATTHERNDLLHSRPDSTPSGEQRLSRRDPAIPSTNIYWPLERVHEAAELFARLSIEGSSIFHDEIVPLFPDAN